MIQHPTWIMLHPKMTYDHLGFLPTFLDLENPASAREQLDMNYKHGGWRSFEGFKRVSDDKYDIKYPGDPACQALAKTYLRDETIVLYPHSWVAIFQKDGTFEISRMD